LQRLFATFPNGPPGAGLLLLRLVAGGFLIAGRTPIMGPVTHTVQIESQVILGSVGVLILLGLWTPVLGTFVALAELSLAFSRAGDGATHILLAALGVGLALLGPGAWSIDARIFGRKRIHIKSS
jgi:putative oxidoreductase